MKSDFRKRPPRGSALDKRLVAAKGLHWDYGGVQTAPEAILRSWEKTPGCSGSAQFSDGIMTQDTRFSHEDRKVQAHLSLLMMTKGGNIHAKGAIERNRLVL
jgi:hypothetical protein